MCARPNPFTLGLDNQRRLIHRGRHPPEELTELGRGDNPARAIATD